MLCEDLDEEVLKHMAQSNVLEVGRQAGRQAGRLWVLAVLTLGSLYQCIKGWGPQQQHLPWNHC